MSTQPHWLRLSSLFESALDLPPEERDAWLSANSDDPALLADVRQMLRAHERSGGVLDRPLAGEETLRAQLERGLAGRYTIERELGRGGMATVYLAREQKHERLVVLKVLKPEVAEAYGAHRFLNEVRLAARLAHPHVLAFIDSGEIDDVGSATPLLFYVMPYVGGETLRDRLRRERMLDPATAVVLLRDLADALAYAHAEGVVHRDLKPENVLCVSGHAYLIDFGIARLAALPPTGEHRTAEGAVIGTVGYMSPEQAAGMPGNFPADVYAWGVVAREMLTGAEPGDLALGLVTLPAALPAACARLIKGALSDDPAARPSSDSLLEEMNRCAGPHGEAAWLVEPPRRRWWPAAVLATAVAIAAAAAWGSTRTRATATGAVPEGAPAAGVAVAVLRNETGDSSLAMAGRLAGDWITQGLQETGLVEVVPWPYALQASEQEGDDRVAIMRRETGAGTVITGAYYLVGDRIRFQVEITDAASGTLIAAPTPVEAPRDSLSAAVRQLRERVMGALAVRANEQLAPVPGLVDRPPTYAAYRAFDRGVSLHLTQDYGRAAAAFREAFALDSTFVVPLIYAALSSWNDGAFASAETLIADVRRRRLGVSEYHDLLAQYMEAHLAGDRPRALAAVRRAVAIAPSSRAPYNLALTALQLNRPREALAALQSLDPDHGAIRGWPSYWTQLTHAHHLLGQHEAERAAAREMLRRHPDLRVTLALEVRALAAEGRVAAIDSLLDRARALPPDTYWSQGGAMLIAGEELAAHGFGSLAPAYFERAVTWLANHLAREPDHASHRLWMGAALYDLGRWRDARPYFASLVEDDPDRLEYRGYAAAVAARLGRRDAERILGDATPRTQSLHNVHRARIAAIRHDTTTAVALISEALRQGIDGYAWLHGSAYRDLQPLLADSTYRELVKTD